MGTPAYCAATACAPVWFCVGAHTSQPSDRTCAVAFIGSIVAWYRNGTSYTAAIFLAAAPRAASGSPSLRATTPGRTASCANRALIPALESPAFGPSSHSTSSARRPWSACQ